MFKIFKKADIILFVILIVIGLGLSFWSAFGSAAGQKAVVTVGGKAYGTYSLSKDQEITIRQDRHINKITIKDGRVQMSYSDCRNQLCVKDGAIHLTSQSIVCLPNKVMVEISGGEEEYDAVSN